MSSNSNLISDIEALLAVAKSSDVNNLDYETRIDMLAKVESIQHQLDDPVLSMYRNISNETQNAALRNILRMGVLKDIPRDEAITVSRLAALKDMEEGLLIRLMRQVASTGILRSLGDNEYAHTRFSLAYIDTSEVDFFNVCMDEVAPTAHRLTEYLESHEPAAILDPCYSPFSWANDREGKNFYEILLEQPDRLARFNASMMTREAQDRITGLFPFTELAKNMDRSDSKRPFIIDVAGGRGQSLITIKRELDESNFSGLGRWILQEKKGVLDTIPDDELQGIEKMAIDYFEPQPNKGAHIYYLRRIVHNWHDEQAKLILKNIADAMLPDSTLLIGEMVIPDRPGVNKYVYMMDMCMLVIGGKERTESEFSSLLDAAGLKLAKVWVSKTGDQTVIECKLK